MSTLSCVVDVAEIPDKANFDSGMILWRREYYFWTQCFQGILQEEMFYLW